MSADLTSSGTARASVSPRRPGVIAASFVAITALIGTLLGAVFGVWLIGSLLGVSLAVGAIFWAYTSAIPVVMRSAGAESATAREQPRLHNLVQGLCLTAGVTEPSIHVISEAAPNAMVVAVAPNKSAIAVTTRMLLDCDRVELEAVIAHLVARIRSGQAIAGTATAVLIGAPLLGAELLMRRGTAGLEGEAAPTRSTAGALAAAAGRVLAAVARPLLAPLITAFVPRDLIGQADLAACQLTRYPPAMCAVLERTLGEGARRSTTPRALGVTNHLWLLPAAEGLDGRGPHVRLHGSLQAHPPTEVRIAHLKEL